MFTPKYTTKLKSIDQTRAVLRNKKSTFKIFLIHNYDNEIATKIIEYLEHKYEDIMDHIHLSQKKEKGSNSNNQIISLNSVDIEIGMFHNQSVAEYCGFCTQCHGDNLPMLQVYDVKGRKMRELFFDSSKNVEFSKSIEHELDSVFDKMVSSVQDSHSGHHKHHSYWASVAHFKKPFGSHHSDNNSNDHHSSRHSILSIPSSIFSNTSKKAHDVAHRIAHSKISKSLEDFLKSSRKLSRNKETSSKSTIKIRSRTVSLPKKVDKRSH